VQSGVIPHDLTSRLRVQSALQYRDALLRFCLHIAIPRSLDALYRFRLLVVTSQSAVVRFRVRSALLSVDMMSRYRLQSGVLRHDTNSRFCLIQDITPRNTISAIGRDALSGAIGRDALMTGKGN
jgi:hypothetical protein